MNQRTNLLQHYPADVPFNGYIDIPCAEPDMEVKVQKAAVKADCGGDWIVECPEAGPYQGCENVAPCCPPCEVSCVHEKHIVDICVAVFRTEKVCISTPCPPQC